MSVDQASSLFWFCIAFVVSVASYRLGLGTFRSPSIGFMPFGAALLLGLLSVISFLQASMKVGVSSHAPLFRNTLWPRVLFVLLVLLAYAQTIPLLGYNVSTFVLMALLFWIVEKQKVWKVMAYAFLTTVITYYVFSKWLNCQFPVGPFGF